MRHTTLCSGEVRLEFFPDRGLACATVSADGDFEDRAPVICDPDALRAVLDGLPYHIAGKGWMCSLSLADDVVQLELWRDGLNRRRCRVPIAEYEAALEDAFAGARLKAYAA